MANIIKLVQGDSRPALVVTLIDQTTGNPCNLTNATVVLKFRAMDSEVLTATVPGTVVDALAGACVFNWAQSPNSLAGEPGIYEGEVEITYGDGTVQTVFDLLHFMLRAQF